MNKNSTWLLFLSASVALNCAGCAGQQAPTNNGGDNATSLKAGRAVGDSDKRPSDVRPVPPESPLAKLANKNKEGSMPHKDLPFTGENNWDGHPNIKRAIPWINADESERSPNDWIVYSANVDGAKWRIRMNDFPAEPLYTLLIDGEPVIHFNNWPAFWDKPG